MFGYVRTDYPNLLVKDTILYRSAYCGLCKSIGKECGTRGRMSLNYDLAFLSVLIHNLTGTDFEISKQRCIIHPLVRRPIAKPDKVSLRIARLNVILAYYKCLDDVIDSNKGRLKRAFFRKGFKRAEKKEPTMVSVVKENYERLRLLEKNNCDSVDYACEPFGTMMKELSVVLLADKSNENTDRLFYELGRWIYLIDALDDYDKDKKKGTYNVLVNKYNSESKATLIKENGSEIQMIFGQFLSGITECCDLLKYNFNHALTDNILKSGLIAETKRIMENEKCKNTTKF